MSRALSLNARMQQDAASAEDLPVVLLEITHADLEAPLRLSSDNKDLISLDPLVRGTRSTWRGADPATEPFRWVPMSLELPGDEEDVPAALRIVVDFFEASLPAMLRSFETRARLNMAVVMASTPDLAEQQYLDLEIVSSGMGSQVTIEASRKPIEEEGVPMHLMTRRRFPGLFR